MTKAVCLFPLICEHDVFNDGKKINCFSSNKLKQALLDLDIRCSLCVVDSWTEMSSFVSRWSILQRWKSTFSIKLSPFIDSLWTDEGLNCLKMLFCSSQLVKISLTHTSRMVLLVGLQLTASAVCSLRCHICFERWSEIQAGVIQSFVAICIQNSNSIWKSKQKRNPSHPCMRAMLTKEVFCDADMMILWCLIIWVVRTWRRSAALFPVQPRYLTTNDI